ncbi:MAG TPA: hypothetical protein VMW12_07440 [Candidatus Dormibacteraeota bacterium]|nr:hypothetical protein [Candidatus Dormibacteraeota bacterium]
MLRAELRKLFVGIPAIEPIGKQPGARVASLLFMRGAHRAHANVPDNYSAIWSYRKLASVARCNGMQRRPGVCNTALPIDVERRQ